VSDENPQSPQERKPDKRIFPKPLGQILLEHTSISPEQLQEALESQKEQKGRLGDILVLKKFLKPEHITKAVAIQMGYPFLEKINAASIDPLVVEKIPITFAKNNNVLPIAMDDHSMTVVISDPVALTPIDDLRVLLQKQVFVAFANADQIQDAINNVYERSTAHLMSGIDEESLEDLDMDLDEPIDLLDATDDAPVIRFVNTLLFRAVKEKASDIHIEPYEREVAIRFRIDGTLYNVFKAPKQLQASISSRVKVMADLNIAEKRLPQDGRIRIKIAGKDVDIRVSTVPTAFGERIVMRLQDKTAVMLDLDSLGFRKQDLVAMRQLIRKSYGIILVTGPTGSGKSTTLYSCLSEINSPDINILTVEDPVEIQIPGIGQVQVNPKIDLTFAKALRHFLRQDPDVVMVGEIRDRETAELAINASLTGHLVFSTLHTNDASATMPRLLDMGVEPFLISTSLLAVIAQRLMRRLCTNCKEKTHYSDEDVRAVGFDPSIFRGKVVYKARGCAECSNTGYRGRIVISELLVITDEIRKLIVQRADGSEIKHMAEKQGMKQLRDDALSKVLDGVSTLEELASITQSDSANGGD
jgi:general secretion pathway protein E